MRNADTGSYRYIESKDIREHLENFGFRFSPGDTAYLIWMNGSLSVEERHGAWRDVMGSGDSMLKELLSSAIALEETLTQRLTASCKAVCECIYYDHHRGVIKPGQKCGSLKECLDTAVNKNAKYAEISKRMPDGRIVYALLRSDGAVLRVYAEDEADIQRSFNSLGFEFPSPFEKGQMLRVVNGEGIFRHTPLRYLGCRFDPDFGMEADCEFINALGQKDRAGFPLVTLERFRKTQGPQ